MSYAQLSNINIYTIALTDPDKKAKVTQQFHNASEALQRTDQRIVEEDKIIMEDFTEQTLNLRHFLQTSAVTLANTSSIITSLAKLQEILPVGSTNIMELERALEDKTNMERDFFQKGIKKCFLEDFLPGRKEDYRNIWKEAALCALKTPRSADSLPYVELEAEVSDDELLSRCMSSYNGRLSLDNDTISNAQNDINNAQNDTHDAQNDTHDAQNHTDDVQDDKDDAQNINADDVKNPQNSGQDARAFGNFGHLGKSDSEICNEHFDEAMEKMISIYEYLPLTINYLTNLTDMYNEAVDWIFTESGKNASQFVEHGICLQNLSTIRNQSLPALIEMKELMENAMTTASYDTFNSSIRDLHRLYQGPDVPEIDALLESIDKSCWWMNKMLDDHHTKDTFHNSRAMLSAAATTVHTMPSKVQSLKKTVEQVYKPFDAVVQPFLLAVQQYQEQKITKLDLATRSFSLTQTDAVNDILSHKADLSNYANAIVENSIFLASQVERSMLGFNAIELPVLNLKSLQTFKLVQYAMADTGMNASEFWEELFQDETTVMQQVFVVSVY